MQPIVLVLFVSLLATIAILTTTTITFQGDVVETSSKVFLSRASCHSSCALPNCIPVLDKWACQDAPCEFGTWTSNDTCECADGYQGDRCELHCVNGIKNGNACTCNNGWGGDSCEDDFDECAELWDSPWWCVNTAGSWEARCGDGYRFDNTTLDPPDCVDIDECTEAAQVPINICSPHSTCVNTEGSFFCNPCDDGYTGNPNVQCVDINECLSDPCINRPCVNTEGSWFCDDCFDGFIEVESHVCVNASTGIVLHCLEGDWDGKECVCNAGFQGIYCEDQIDECISSPCEIDEECLDTVGSYACVSNVTVSPCEDHGGWNGTACVCLDGWCGERCEVPPCGECGNLTCANAGQCTVIQLNNTSTDWICQCAHGGISGQLCDDILLNECGDWIGPNFQADPCPSSECLEGECVCAMTETEQFGLSDNTIAHTFAQFVVAHSTSVNLSQTLGAGCVNELELVPNCSWGQQTFEVGTALGLTIPDPVSSWVASTTITTNTTSECAVSSSLSWEDPLPCLDGIECDVACDAHCPITQFAEEDLDCPLGHRVAFPWQDLSAAVPINGSQWQCVPIVTSCHNGHRWVMNTSMLANVSNPDELADIICVCEVGWKGDACELVWLDDPRLCYLPIVNLPQLDPERYAHFVAQHGHEPYGWDGVALELAGGHYPGFEWFSISDTFADTPGLAGTTQVDFWLHVHDVHLVTGGWFGNQTERIASAKCANGALCHTSVQNTEIHPTLINPESTAEVEVTCECNATEWASHFSGPRCECPICEHGYTDAIPVLNVTTWDMIPQCVCDEGWRGNFCEQECLCPSGYEFGEAVSDGCPVCVDIDECEDHHVCATNCTNTPGSFACDPCPAGYIESFEGHQICTITDICLTTNPCTGGRECRTSIKDPWQLVYPGVVALEVTCGPCPDGYDPSGDHDCAQLPCNSTLEYSGPCPDPDEYNCDANVTCDEYNVMMGIIVVGQVGICGDCPEGYYYDQHNEYNQNATCLPEDGCQGNHLCEDGRQCIHDPNAGQGSFDCGPCPTGFTTNGTLYNCFEYNPCNVSSDLCRDGRICSRNVSVPNLYTCSDCTSGYEDDSEGGCQDVDECVVDSGICNHLPHSACVNSVGSYSCECVSGWTFNGTDCVDIDECDTPSNGSAEYCPFYKGVCVNTVGGVTCSCESPFVLQELPWPQCIIPGGNACAFASCPNGPCLDVVDDITVCQCAALEYGPNPCQNDGYLVVQEPVPDGLDEYHCPEQPTFECRCRGPWKGPSCDVPDPTGCEGDAFVLPFGNQTCGCDEDHFGPQCEFFRNTSFTCENGGEVREVSVLSTDFGSSTTGLACDCADGFDGERCENVASSCQEGFVDTGSACELNCTYCPDYLHPMPTGDGVDCVWAIYFASQHNGNMGGLFGADALCLAERPTSWFGCPVHDYPLAFLSVSWSSAYQRFTGLSTQHATAPIYFMQSYAGPSTSWHTPISFAPNGWNGLFACGYVNPECIELNIQDIYFALDEVTSRDNYIWTGSLVNGAHSGFSCGDWFQDSVSFDATSGHISTIDYEWIERPTRRTCDLTQSFLCAC